MNLDDKLCLNKMIEIPAMVIVVRAFFFIKIAYMSTGFLRWMSVYHYRSDVSEGINVNRTSASKECDVCHFWYFLIIVLTFNQMSAIEVMIY